MTSEIRTNSLKSRAGLSTVTFTDSGPMFSGITTFVDNSGFTFGVGAGSSIFTPATNTLTFGTNSNERLRIASDGKVGIGTDNPDRIFHITTASPIIKLTDSDNSLSAEINGSSGNIYFDTHNSNRDIIFRGSTTEVARVTGDGKVGIGTQIPQAKFVVSNAGANGFEFNPNFNSNNSIIASYNRTGGGSYSQLTLSASQHIFAQGGTEYGRFDSAGRFLIGVDTATNNDSYVQSFKKTGNDATITVGNVATSASGLCRYDFAPSNKVVGSRIECHASEDFSTSANRTADLVFITRKDGTLSEKLRITSGGLLQLNNDAAKIQLGASQDLSIYHDGSSNRIIAANADLILQSQNYAIRSENGSTTYLNIKSNGAIALPDGTQGIRFGSAASEDFAIFHSGSNSHIDHFGTGNLYHDFSNDFYMRFYQSAGVVRTALYVSNGGSGNPEFQLRSNPTSAPTNQGTHSPAVRFRGAGWNTNSGSVEVGTILQSEHYYWQNSGSNVFGQTYPDFKIKMKNSDNGSYVSKFTFLGNGNASFNGSLTQNSSDIRLKENIQPITNSLEKVKSLSGFTYNWNKTAQDLGFKGGGHDELQVGLSAQDVEKIQPEIVKPAPVDNTYKTIQYEKLVPLLVEAIKELKANVETLESESLKLKQVLTKVETLEQENIALRVRVTNLEGE